jgi:hypothetical protein
VTRSCPFEAVWTSEAWESIWPWDRWDQGESDAGRRGLMLWTGGFFSSSFIQP